MKKLLSFLFLALPLGAAAQEPIEDFDFDSFLKNYDYQEDTVFHKKEYAFRVYLKDKAQSPYSLTRPKEFLSEKALARRAKYHIKVDEYDLPVSPAYLQQLTTAGYRVHNVSKWNNTATVFTSDSLAADRLRRLPFVDSVRITYISPRYSTQGRKNPNEVTNQLKKAKTADYYGWGEHQVKMLGIDEMHLKGFTGKGVTIAVIDGGFRNANQLSSLHQDAILTTKNYVLPQLSVYDTDEEHGLNALSCIAADAPYTIVGTAPKAQFHLIVSEDSRSEQLIEEDNWAAAIEYADSVGSDMVSSSLGYNNFDYPSMVHKYAHLDGHYATASRAASLAASRGMVVCVSAGNDGDNFWKKISIPADATDILTVGALRADSLNTLFSSLGNTADGRTKPDVTAMGEDVLLLSCRGEIEAASGTSFSCPLTAGAVACLMQAFPEKTPIEIMKAVRESGNNAASPDNVFGWGLPNIPKAYRTLGGK